MQLALQVRGHRVAEVLVAFKTARCIETKLDAPSGRIHPGWAFPSGISSISYLDVVFDVLEPRRLCDAAPRIAVSSH